MDTDDWREYKREQKDEKARKRKYAAEFLSSLGIKFTSKNQGAHLIVPGRIETFDFWPGTDKFIGRKTKKRYRGLMQLVKIVQPDIAQECEQS